MDSRRTFLETMAGVAGTLTAPASVLGVNDRIRLGIVGPGDQGLFTIRAGLKCPNTESVAFADVYTVPCQWRRKWVPVSRREEATCSRHKYVFLWSVWDSTQKMRRLSPRKWLATDRAREILGPLDLECFAMRRPCGLPPGENLARVFWLL